MLVLCVAGAALWLRGSKKRSLWIVILALVASIYPLMFIVWHGNPQEIERHALQIAVQLRLAGWLAVITWLAWLSSKIEEGNALKQNSSVNNLEAQKQD
jgi:ABC-type Fe3+ transport system permease subunit